MGKLENLLWNGLIALTLAVLGISYFGSGQHRLTHTLLAQVPPESVAVPDAPSSGRQVRSSYVPAYSSFQAGRGHARIDLAATLSVHNTSRDRPLVVERISYFDTDGRLVQEYLSQPITLPPLGTTQAFVTAEDRRGGPGANFVVEWQGEPGTSEPVIEALMIGISGTTSYSFVTRGQPILVTAAR